MTAIGIRIEFRTAKWPEQLKAVAPASCRCGAWAVGRRARRPTRFLTLYGPNGGQANHRALRAAGVRPRCYEQPALPDGPERETLFREAKRLFVAYAP